MMNEIFLHQRTKETEFVEVDTDGTVEEFGVGCVGEGAKVWFEDAEKPIDPSSTFGSANVNDHCHIHVSLCPIVQVKVLYGGNSKERSFTPAMTVDRVFKWVTGPEGFKITQTEAAKLVLVPHETKVEINVNEHVGHFADDDCYVTFDLVADDGKFQG